MTNRPTHTTIRDERPADHPAITELHDAAFGQPGEGQLVEALRAAGKAVVSLVLEADGQVAGHILFSPVTVESDGDSPTHRALGLAPMAVLPQWQRCGFGSQLVRAGLDRCRTAGYRAAVVLGHPEYYPRFGFVPASRFGLRSEYPVPDEVFMAQELVEGGWRDASGLIRYQPEFGQL